VIEGDCYSTNLNQDTPDTCAQSLAVATTVQSPWNL
jgi:hypothetical protein